ncbi:amidophosphoribosyltransferase [Candidatus Bathyarchaeota archaeon]|nr:amidophosphoribosyltransferase [Candidatus Bathyarchaeota archaeon]
MATPMNCRESCAVFSVSSNLDEVDVSPVIFGGLLALQHRGQESTGITVLKNGKIQTFKGLGLAIEVFNHNILKSLSAPIGIGHVRYSTYGSSDIINAQPMEFESKLKFALCFNGTIVNYEELRVELEHDGYVFKTTSDSEVIGFLISKALKRSLNLTDAIIYGMEKLRGAYSVLLLAEDGSIVVFRDMYGFRPLCVGYLKDLEAYVFSSETSGLDAVDATFIEDIPPGSINVLKDSEITRLKVYSSKHAHCMFEWVYFSRQDSTVEGVNVFSVRWKLGEKLAELNPVEADYVVPVPETSRIAALGFSSKSGIPVMEGFGVNRYALRTFIMPRDRGYFARLKLNPLKQVLEGKRIILIDDSIVRGTTSKAIVSMLRKAGVKEIHLKITCPPLIAPCYMGVDFPTSEELIAYGKSVEDIRKLIGVDSLTYMTIDYLVEAIGLPKDELCLACLTGEYPEWIKPFLGKKRAIRK